MVLVHGWTCDHTFWSGQISAHSQNDKGGALSWGAGQGRSPVPALAVVANPAQIREAALKARFPNLTYKNLPDAGHFLMMEKPAEFNTIVLEWLAGR